MGARKQAGGQANRRPYLKAVLVLAKLDISAQDATSTTTDGDGADVDGECDDDCCCDCLAARPRLVHCKQISLVFTTETDLSRVWYNFRIN